MVNDHLRCRAADRLEDDIARNYDPEVVILSAEGSRGHDGVRRVATILRRYLPDLQFTVDHEVHAEDVVLIVWGAHSGGRRVEEGTDTFLVRRGRITAQTIYYSVHDPQGAAAHRRPG